MSGTTAAPGASNNQSLVNEQQTRNRLLMSLVNLFTKGVIVQPVMPVYTVAALPATAATGSFAWASNGRKGGEGVGAGTGIPVYWNAATSQWFTYANVLVTS